MPDAFRYTAAALFLLLLFSACSKKSAEEKVMEPSFLNRYFEENILNRDITVTQASWQGRDTTPMFGGYVFKLLKNTYYDGPFEARYQGRTYTGRWQSNDDYSKLILDIPLNDTLEWISIHWKFRSKSTTTLELVPWFDSDGVRYVKFQK